MSNRLKLIAAVVLVVIAIPAGRWVRPSRLWRRAALRCAGLRSARRLRITRLSD